MEYYNLRGIGRVRPDRGARPPRRGTEEVRAYWEGLRNGGGIPLRSSLDPRGIAGSLERVFLAERVGPGLAQIRIAGAVLADLAGVDPRGLPLSCLFSVEARIDLERCIRRVFDMPVAADLHLESPREAGRPTLDTGLVLLPMLDTGASCKLLLGCFGHCGDIGKSPRRFGITKVVEEPLTSLTPPGRTETAAQSHRHLRLVHSAQ